MQIKQYDPATKPKKRPRLSEATVTPSDIPAKRPRFSSSISDAMATTPITHASIDIRARLSPAARMDLALKVLDVGNLSITGLLMYRLASAGTGHFRNAFLSEGGGLEIFLKELIGQYPVAENRIFQAVGHNFTLKTVSAEMELVKSYTLLSSTEISPNSMRDWTIGIPKHLAPCLSSILCAGAFSNRAVKENKTKKDTFTVRIYYLHLTVRST